ncbi:MAG: hypothetical protein MJY99_10320 [Fibrobacter sp.]|nr:hypothetical protein [Fibrobacter sp.]
MKGIYEEEDEIELKGTTKTVDPLEEKEGEIITEKGDVNESDGELVPVEFSGSSAKCIVKEQGLDEGELDQQTASALNIRYRVFNDTAIRTAIDSEKNVWFVADDIVKVLGYTKDTATVVKKHCNKVYDSKDLDGTNELARKIMVDTKGGKQAMIAISEGDMYRLIMRSTMPEARNFEKWVVEDVLPQIRKTGKYAVKRKITMSTPEAQAKYEAAKAALSEQCELFPNVVQSITFPKPMTDKINAVKKRLFDEGHTFPNDKEFLKFLVTRALEQLEA